ncbi:MAG: signal recognition particle protein [Candidatus Eisenbacteria bacterium]|nr:signal recognition particle protein [Candidatus Eisenbacteria bacterium]
MFEQLSDRLELVFKKLRGQGTLTEENIRESMRDVRRALLEADVHVSVAKDFVKRVEEKAVGQQVLKSLSPGQQVVRVVHEVLVDLLGTTSQGVVESREIPTRILIVGLQGSGKTTFVAKLGHHLRKRKKVPVLAACDVLRPAAMDQLETLGKEAGLRVHVEKGGTDAVGIAKRALETARSIGADYLLVDTAGRLHIDEAMMEEVERIKREVRPHQVILVVDGMSGQDAVAVAQAFHDRLGVDGVVLSKMDGDARGGAALSIRAVTGRPILFMGTGERVGGLEVFHPDRLASRILGMGDILSLVEKAQEAVTVEQATKLEEKLRKSEFTFEDFLDQLNQVKKMGPLEDLIKMIPGIGNKLPAGLKVDEKQLTRVEAIIQSMTRKERAKPEIIDGSRRKRIAKGSGSSVQDVNKLLKDFLMMRQMVSRMSRMQQTAMLRGKRR